MDKIALPDFVPMFAAYYKEHPAWGSLHVVLDDGNVADAFVDGCVQYAIDCDDAAGAVLACVLKRMSKTQRKKLPAAVRAYLKTWNC